MVAQPETREDTRLTWQIEPGSTYVQFDVAHMLVSTVRGRFPDVRGTILVDYAAPSESAVELTIDAASLDTGNRVRDEYVRTEAFLDTTQYPEITFRSTTVEALEEGRVRVVGDLTIRGITREVTLDARYKGAARSPLGGRIAGFEGRATLSLTDYGVTGNLPMPDGGLALGDTLALELLVEATAAD